MAVTTSRVRRDFFREFLATKEPYFLSGGPRLDLSSLSVYELRLLKSSLESESDHFECLDELGFRNASALGSPRVPRMNLRTADSKRKTVEV